MKDQTQTGYGCEHQHGLGKLEACFGNGQGETERLKGSFPVATEPEGHEMRWKSWRGGWGMWLPVLGQQRTFPSFVAHSMLCSTKGLQSCRVSISVPRPFLWQCLQKSRALGRNQATFLLSFPQRREKQSHPVAGMSKGAWKNILLPPCMMGMCVILGPSLHGGQQRFGGFQPPNPCITFFLT